LLLKLAGISDPARDLIFVDDSLVEQDMYGAEVTLVDHNVLAEELKKKNWKVLEIVDHHRDEGKFLDSCPGACRNVAFENDEALVASACALVAERLKEQ
jgi:hypothetical protein